MKPRMHGDWCGTYYGRLDHVVKIDRGWYRIVLYSPPKMSDQGVPVHDHEKTLFATNPKDANEKAKLLVTGHYDTDLWQPRML